VSSDNFVVVDITGESKIIGEVSYTSALTTLHEKAIYLHEAKQFHVERFDFKERKAYVKRVDSDYYTDAIDYTQVKALREFEKAVIGRGIGQDRGQNVERVHGDVSVNRQIVGFKKIKFYTNENVGAGKLSYASAADAHDGVLAALPRPVSRCVRGIHAHRTAERAYGTGQRASDNRFIAIDVRSAGSGSGSDGEHFRRITGLGAGSLPL
jgi:ATP-dependent helicase YprA (DUF1998 family)